MAHGRRFAGGGGGPAVAGEPLLQAQPPRGQLAGGAPGVGAGRAAGSGGRAAARARRGRARCAGRVCAVALHPGAGGVVWRPCAGRALGAARTLARRKPGAGPHRPGHRRRARLCQPAGAKRPANRRTRRGPAPRAARQQPPAGPHRATRAALPAARRGAHLHPVTAGHPRHPPAARGATPRRRPMAHAPPPRGPPQLLHPRQRRAPDVVRPGTPTLPAPALGPKQRRTHQGRVHAPAGV